MKTVSLSKNRGMQGVGLMLLIFPPLPRCEADVKPSIWDNNEDCGRTEAREAFLWTNIHCNVARAQASHLRARISCCCIHVGSEAPTSLWGQKEPLCLRHPNWHSEHLSSRDSTGGDKNCNLSQVYDFPDLTVGRDGIPKRQAHALILFLVWKMFSRFSSGMSTPGTPNIEWVISVCGELCGLHQTSNRVRTAGFIQVEMRKTLLGSVGWFTVSGHIMTQKVNFKTSKAYSCGFNCIHWPTDAVQRYRKWSTPPLNRQQCVPSLLLGSGWKRIWIRTMSGHCMVIGENPVSMLLATLLDLPNLWEEEKTGSTECVWSREQC